MECVEKTGIREHCVEFWVDVGHDLCSLLAGCAVDTNRISRMKIIHKRASPSIVIQIIWAEARKRDSLVRQTHTAFSLFWQNKYFAFAFRRIFFLLRWEKKINWIIIMGVDIDRISPGDGKSLLQIYFKLKKNEEKKPVKISIICQVSMEYFFSFLCSCQFA